MKNLSIRLKITIWFSAILVLVIGITFTTIFWINRSVMQKNIKDNLIKTVEDNVDEVEFFDSLNKDSIDYDGDIYISYKDGLLEIDDDFLDKVNGIITALYSENGALLYGENRLIKKTSKIHFEDEKLQKISYEGAGYYIFDRKLQGRKLDGLWLRGIVSENEDMERVTTVVHISFIALPVLFVLAVFGGYSVAKRMLRPVNQITEAAAQISQGSDLKKRIALGRGGDELHQLAAVFDDMFARLEEAFETERRFTSDASHELRTPMAVIMAQCEYILNETRSVEEYEEAFYVIQRQGRKMSRLIDDMLVFTRMEQRNESYPKEYLNLSELVEDICQDMALLKEKQIILTWELEPDIFFEGNRLLITRLLINLISNAYRYGKQNGNIFVTLNQKEKIFVTVKDNGIGISREQQEKIFERFYRADASRTLEGSGLGLAMVREIVQFYGGKIEVSSELEKGSVFTISLPILKNI